MHSYDEHCSQFNDLWDKLDRLSNEYETGYREVIFLLHSMQARYDI
jgi:hypothetical protein